MTLAHTLVILLFEVVGIVTGHAGGSLGALGAAGHAGLAFQVVLVEGSSAGAHIAHFVPVFGSVTRSAGGAISAVEAALDAGRTGVGLQIELLSTVLALG